MTSLGEPQQSTVPFAMRTDPGTQRPANEDSCGSYVEAPTRLLVAVADGVSGEEGGEIASQTAIEVTLRTFQESPAAWGVGKRLYRAVQQANIEIHDRALVVTELRGMSTTLTAIALDGGIVHAAHVGDSRLYLIRAAQITQKTRDHTVPAARRRMGLMSAKRAEEHPDKSTLTRCLGRELIAAVDRITFPVSRGDALLLCSDGLYNVLRDEELRDTTAGREPTDSCRALIEMANSRGTPDNLTVAIVTPTAEAAESRPGWRDSLARLLGRRGAGQS
jgi:serine/threonine protein phosphatase PrpC